jgi:ubiquinone/menaquinone biosynthesis C-methylase UbiE
MKKAIKDLLLRMGLLEIVGSLYSLFLTLKNNANRNRKFIHDNQRFSLPPVLIAFDAHGEVDWENYYNYGLHHATIVSSLITELMGDKENGNIFEWGCGPGRVIRHLPALINRQAFEFVGSDYNRKTIAWCNEHLEGIKFIENGLAPPLDIADETFDFIYCISVFTHLSEKHHHEWLKELLRVLKPGGFLMFTTHGDLFSSSLHSKDLDLYHAGKLVVWNRSEEGKRDFTAFHSPKYIREQFLVGQTITKFVEAGAMGQDIWVVQKN